MSAQIIAASATGLVQEVGSYAGYAAILGLGILALLYFTQARELKRLRDWAGDAPERGTALEQQRILQPDPNRRVVAQPIQSSTPTTPAAQAATAALYASVGAPAPGTVPPPGSLARPAAAPGAAAPGAPAVPGAVPVPGAPAAPSALSPAVPGAATAAGAKPDAVAAPARATVAARSPSAASVQPYANGGALGQPTAESAAARPEPIGPPPPLLDDEDDDYGSFSGRRIGVIVGGVVAVVLVAVVLIIALGGDDAPPKPNDFGDQPAAQTSGDGSSASSSSAGGSGSGTKTAAAGLTAAERRATNVAVLNGTTQTGLARNVGDKIEQDGYTIGKVETNPDQTLTATEIRYTDGHQEAANAVAKVIGIARSAVQPADVNTTASADADVVVIVGSDQIG